MNEILLTFVVPCYKVEKYIQHCLDSIYSCGLTEAQFEVLCINDCSPDNTVDILSWNCEKHSNLRIVNHKTNRGLGGGRNTGIREARGLYLWFVDSDDEIVGNGVSGALSKAVDNNLDVLCFNYFRIDDDGKLLSRNIVFGETSVSDGYRLAKDAFSGGVVNHMGFVWRFLYRTEFLRSHNLYFPEKVHWEDTVFMPKSILLAERVASVPQVFYAYRINPDSISGVFGKAYPAKSIYEFAFCAGSDLLKFSEEVKDEKLRRAFHDTAVNRYINGFPLYLLRTDRKERSRFYRMVSGNSAELRRLKTYMDWRSKAVLIPFGGSIITNILSLWYKKTH